MRTGECKCTYAFIHSTNLCINELSPVWVWDKVGTKANIGVLVLLKVIFLFGVHDKSKLNDTNAIQLLIKSVLWCRKTKSRGSYNSN